MAACTWLAVKTIVADIVAPPGILVGTNSSFSLSDMLTYEVITADTSGWYGIWNDENGGLISTTLDSCTWGNAVYF